MSWFKRKILSKPFDIGVPYYNLDLIISELMPYDIIDSFMAFKDDLLIPLNGITTLVMVT